jgi:hypothetical protein
MTGTHQSMFSLNLPLQLNTSTSAVFMSLSAGPNIAKERVTAVWSVVILTQVMLSLQATFTSMQGYVCCGVETVATVMKLKITGVLLT